MGKIIIGCWDCQYCGTTRISGELRECPNCGRARDKDVKFYMANPENYAKDPDSVSREADWVCPYCDCLNPAAASTCQSCGALRDSQTKDYFQNREAQDKKLAEQEKERQDQIHQAEKPHAPQTASAAPSGRGRGRLFLILAVIAAVIALVVFLVSPKQKAMEIASCNWERSVEVQLYKEMEDSGWSLPQGAYDVTSREEIYGYESVFDHYEIRTRQVPEQVLEGYDTSLSYHDLGNGHFEEIENRIPRYRTEYHTESYREPIYRSVPIYQTKYYFLIMRWVSDHYETTSGQDDTPYFADIGVSDTCREGAKTERYWIVDTDGNQYVTSYDLWKDLAAGQKIKAEVQFGELLQADPA